MKSASIAIQTEEGLKSIAYTEWGAANVGIPVFCVHGLTRNSRDFDALANALSNGSKNERRRIICIDVIGRGESESFNDKSLYGYTAYIQLCLTFLDALNIDQVDWVGTSMGGLIGMMIAAQESMKAQKDKRIRSLILNDVGSYIPKAALQRIGDYVGSDPEFALLENAEQYLRLIMQSFGVLSDDQWQHLTEHSFYQDSNGKFRFKYDPDIALAFQGELDDVDLTPIWNLIDIPVLLIRGKESDLLLSDTANEMADRESCQLVEFEDVGHAPMLMVEQQIDVVRGFLTRT